MFKNNIKNCGLAFILIFVYHNDNDKIVLYVNQKCNIVNKIVLNKIVSVFYKL